MSTKTEPAKARYAHTLTMPSDREIEMTRVFEAPRKLVFEAHSKAEHIRRWWGPRAMTMTVCEMDFRVGGKWRFVLQRGGRDYGFRGEYRKIVEPELSEWTLEFEGAPGQIGVETMRLTEKEGKTTLTVRSDYPSKESRDETLRSGMESGAAETWDRLAEYLVHLA